MIPIDTEPPQPGCEPTNGGPRIETAAGSVPQMRLPPAGPGGFQLPAPRIIDDE
jgi:hypothetical protein